MGFLDKKNEYKKALLSMTAWKLFFFFSALLLPMFFVPFSLWIFLFAFISMHLVTGLLVSIIFQIAHIMPVNEFPLPNEQGLLNDNWYGHQFATTSNFSPKSNLLFWFIGGLNYQIEHHVLPDVCHVHYKNLTKIVSETAQEYCMPYHVKKSLGHAIWDHTKMLRLLGKKQKVIIAYTLILKKTDIMIKPFIHKLLNTNKVNNMKEGTVKFFNNAKGFGFITVKDTNEEVFVHSTNLIDDIREDDDVTFDVEKGDRGLRAVKVRLA